MENGLMYISTSNFVIDLVNFLLILDSNLDWITYEIKLFLWEEKSVFSVLLSYRSTRVI